MERECARLGMDVGAQQLLFDGACLVVLTDTLALGACVFWLTAFGSEAGACLSSRTRHPNTSAIRLLPMAPHLTPVELSGQGRKPGRAWGGAGTWAWEERGSGVGGARDGARDGRGTWCAGRV